MTVRTLEPEGICAALPEADPEKLMDLVVEALNGWEDRRRLFSRDAMPAPAAMGKRIEAVEKHLTSAIEALYDGAVDGIWAVAFLSAELDDLQPDEHSASYLGELVRLRDAARRLLASEAKPVVEWNGEPVVRKTRHHARDSYLIPILVAIAHEHGQLPMSDARDWEAVDAACEFVAAVLAAAGIDAPDAGDTARTGEAAQGRLRRMVKDAAAKLR